jgi:DNA repair and recombination protein RAD52
MDWDKASADLRKKLDPANVKPAKDFGPKGDYIEGWHAMAEANRIFGFDGWSYTVISTTCVANEARKIGKAQKDGWGVSYIATVLVRVGEVMREDIGAGHGYDVDLGLAHESAIKEAVTDALKRALRSFGNPFGLALYDKSRENVGHNAPDADPVDISTAIDTINACETADGLATHWRLLNKNAKHVAADHRVIAAKDTKKLALAGVYPPN